MAVFNLKKKQEAKKPSPLARLRSLLHYDQKKVALHGTADGWSEVSPSDPYKTSPLVNYQGGEFGGRWRGDFPGSGDQHINDDNDKVKNTRGNELDFESNKEKQVSDRVLPDDGQYKIYVQLPDGKHPDEIKALFGENAKFDGKNVYIIVDNFESATKMQGMVPGSIVERKG